MRSRKLLLAGFTIPLFLAGCGGGDNTNPYDGSWQAVYPALDKSSTISTTQTVLCSTPPAALIIKNATGSTTQTATCTTTFIPASGVPAIPPITQITYANISVSIEAKQSTGTKDVLNAVVNGVTHTGQCISTVACAAVSTAGDTLSLTR